MRDLRVSFPRPCDEEWEAMAPVDRSRICARCDKVIHDLSHYEFDEAEALLRRSPDTCVRARIGADGAVALKPGHRAKARRMMVAVAVTAGLLAAAEPALARRDRPGGVIVGNAESAGFRVRVTATGRDGTTFRTTVNRDGRYRIRRVPAGIYTLVFVPSCGESWTIENVVVGDGETVVPPTDDPGACIIIGMVRIEDGDG